MRLEDLQSGDKVRVRIGSKYVEGEVIRECDGQGLIQVRTPLAELIVGHTWQTLLFYARGPRIGDAIIGVYTVHPMDEMQETLEKPWQQIEREDQEYRELLDELEVRLVTAQNSKWNQRHIRQQHADPF